MLRIYGPSDPNTRQMLIENMRSAGLPTSSWKDATQQQKAERERQKIAAQAAKRAKKQGGAVVSVGQGQQHDSGLAEYATGSSFGTGQGPSLEDIIGGSERFNPRNVEQFVEEFGIKDSDLVCCQYLNIHHMLTSFRMRCPKHPSLEPSLPSCMTFSFKAYTGCSRRRVPNCQHQVPGMLFSRGNHILRCAVPSSTLLPISRSPTPR